jgi:hypothetical protein
MNMSMSQPRLLNLLHRINRQGPTNPYALALMMTEEHFRGPLFRACEIAYMFVQLSLFRRTPKITLGRCQVEFAYWVQIFGGRTSDLVRAMFDDMSNYRVCCSFLDANACDGLEQTAIRYNGRPSDLYVQLLVQNLLDVRSAMQRLQIRI